MTPFPEKELIAMLYRMGYEPQWQWYPCGAFKYMALVGIKPGCIGHGVVEWVGDSWVFSLYLTPLVSQVPIA